MWWHILKWLQWREALFQSKFLSVIWLSQCHLLATDKEAALHPCSSVSVLHNMIKWWHLMISRQMEDRGWFPHLVRYRHSLLKAFSFNYSHSYEAYLYNNHFRSTPSVPSAMTSITASFRLGSVSHFCQTGKLQF